MQQDWLLSSACPLALHPFVVCCPCWGAPADVETFISHACHSLQLNFLRKDLASGHHMTAPM